MSGYWWVLSGSADGDNNIFDLVEERSLVAIGWHSVGDVRGSGFRHDSGKGARILSGLWS